MLHDNTMKNKIRIDDMRFFIAVNFFVKVHSSQVTLVRRYPNELKKCNGPIKEFDA
jgi:hypothetical protein